MEITYRAFYFNGTSIRAYLLPPSLFFVIKDATEARESKLQTSRINIHLCYLFLLPNSDQGENEGERGKR